MREDDVIVTLEIDLGSVEMDEAMDRANSLKFQVEDPNEDNVRIKSIRRE